MRAVAEKVIPAPIETVWSVISDPERALSFMSGVTRWEVDSEDAIGLGARYRMLLRIGSADVGGLIEVVEFEPPTDLAWTSITGVDQRGRWRLRRVSNGRTNVEIRLAAGVVGAGLAGWVAERIAQPLIASHLRTTLAQLSRVVEHERLREQAAARHAARTAAAG